MRLILVRHGQTSSNLGGLLDTDVPGAELTALGRTQAAALPAALAGRRISAIYASTLVRTQQTAAPLAEARLLEVRVRPGIREIGAGTMEMLGDPASVRAYLETAFAWSDGDLDRRMPGGESGHEVYARYDEVVIEAVASVDGPAAVVSVDGPAAVASVDGPAAVVVVSHGAIIRSWTASRAANVTTAHAARNALSNTGIVVLDGSPTEGWTAVTWEGEPVVRPHDDGPASEPFTPGEPPAQSPRD